MFPRIHVIRQPFRLPSPPTVPFVVLDVAFAGGAVVGKTHEFIREAGDRLRLWVDHHEHAEGWPQYADDERFVLVPSRVAHACPELVTPEVVARAGEVEAILAHHDFDGMMSAVRFILGGREPYEGADEDARAADSPGRGHVLSPRGERLVAALGEAQASREEAGYHEFYVDVAMSLVRGEESPALAAEIDALHGAAHDAMDRARRLAEGRRIEAPGVSVLRIEARLDGRMRRHVLSILEEEATIGLVLEGTPKRYWATAATYCDAVQLEEATDLDRGRHDFRFGPTKNADRLIQQLSELARRATS